MTIKELADICNGYGGSNDFSKVDEFIKTASPRQLQEFIHLIQTHPNSRQYQLARTALDIQIAEQQLRIAEEQAKSAQILENQTRALVRLTWALVWLTVGLLVVTVGFAVFQLRK